MILIQATGIKKNYGTRTILDFNSLAVYEGDKIGVVGANGAGKSTLLSILSGAVAPDEGCVTCHCTPSYIRQFDQKISNRSGGESQKSRIQEETLDPNTVLFADEPTANLDAAGQSWVLKKLRSAKTFLLISHDRALLDSVCTRIVEVKDGALTFYTGNYSDYEETLEQKRRQHALEYEEYRRKKEALEQAVAQKRRTSETMKAPSRVGNSEARLYKGSVASKKKKVDQVARQLKSRLERLEPVEKERAAPKLRIDFGLTNPPESKQVITVENLRFAYGSRPVLDGVSFCVKNGAHAALTGANGSGKTTLLRLIAEGSEAIRLAPKVKIGYLAQDFSHINPSRTVLENARCGAVQSMAGIRSVLAGLLFCGDDVYKRAEILSGGEKVRLSLAMLIVSDCNVLLLDEPTNYLDLASLGSVAHVLCNYPGTILFVSHDTRFVGQVASEELLLEHGKVLSRARKEQIAAPPDPAAKLLLELRAARLLGELSSAPPDRKTEIEQEYSSIMKEIHSLKI